MEEFESISTATAWELISCGAAGQGHMLQCKGKRGTWYSTWAKGAHGIVHGEKGHMVQCKAKGAHGTVHGQEGHCISRYSIRAAWAHGTEEGLEHSVYRGTVQGREGTL